MKCNQSHPGFKLVSPCPFPTTITITPRAPPQKFVTPLKFLVNFNCFFFFWVVLFYRGRNCGSSEVALVVSRWLLVIVTNCNSLLTEKTLECVCIHACAVRSHLISDQIMQLMLLNCSARYSKWLATFRFSLFNGITTSLGYLMPMPSLYKNSSNTIRPISKGIRVTYFSQGYLSESERSSANGVRTHLLRCHSRAL